MAYKIFQFAERNLVLYEMSEQVNINTLRSCRDYAKSRGASFANQHQLLIFHIDADVDLSRQDLRGFALQASGKTFNTQRIIVAQTDLTFGVSRMFESLRDGAGDGFHVVRTIMHAACLLGLESGDIEGVLTGKSGALLHYAH